MKNKGFLRFVCRVIVQVIFLLPLNALGMQQGASKINGDPVISVSFDNSSVKEVFSFIENKTNYRFSYEEKDLRGLPAINLERNNITVTQLLEELSGTLKLQFKRIDNIINVSPIEPPAKSQDETSYRQNVSGKVTMASNGDPLPGVSIYEKGTTTGTISDFEGNYNVTVSDGATLIFSSIGFKSEQIPVDGKSIINVAMEEDAHQLEEIIIVGYGEQKRSNIIGSISSVEVDELENKTQTRLDQALQGMSAGVFVSRNGGAPGASPTIHIRGAGSINGTQPLWIVDGIRMDPGNHFDIDDVESIEILKDASASAIYGARAAHGVILITTKRGQGDLSVTFKSSIGKRTPLNPYKLQKKPRN